VTAGGKTTPINGPLLTVQLGPGCGQQLTLEMKRSLEHADGATPVEPRKIRNWEFLITV
jgi:hypothetical protein